LLTIGYHGVSLIERSFRERIVLVGVVFDRRGVDEVEASLDELASLVNTAGADEVARVVQRRVRPDPATYVGRGKASELAQLADAVDADTVVFDDELSPAQQRNLEAILGRTAIDRTAVILDIFAQNARTQEGKVQVELAMLGYRLPRLRGRGLGMSQQAGGIGTRGPGEMQLEVDRRRLLRRMHSLEASLADVSRVRAAQRKARQRSRTRGISLVGYTNAGKSTLLNQLTGAGVLVEDRLFSTLDPRTRKLRLPSGEWVTCSDTVGFVRKLPHQLVEAFRSTLEVVGDSDLLVHMVDISVPAVELRIEVVRETLAKIGASSVPELLVFNKVDQLGPGADGSLTRKLGEYPGSLALSAFGGAGVEDMLDAVAGRLAMTGTLVELAVPFARGDIMAACHREGEVVDERPADGSVLIKVILDPPARARFAEFACPRASVESRQGEVMRATGQNARG
jgi:GTP-binding protein HflX